MKTRPLRLSQGDIDEVERIRKRDGIVWSEAARRALAYGIRHMPEGWHPGKEDR